MVKHLEKIFEYFPDLSDKQKEQLTLMGPLYQDWNSKVNVISRKDIDQLYLHHVLHSLSIAKYIKFKDDTKIMDLGTGGGFPGLVLAIIFPNAKFHLIDGTLKKITVTKDVIEKLGLVNATSEQVRAEEHKEKYDFVVNRAVAQLEKLIQWSFPLIHKNHKNAFPNGLITLKGGDLKEEIALVSKNNYVEKNSISNYFNEPYFEEKYLIYVQR